MPNSSAQYPHFTINSNTILTLQIIQQSLLDLCLLRSCGLIILTVDLSRPYGNCGGLPSFMGPLPFNQPSFALVMCGSQVWDHIYFGIPTFFLPFSRRDKQLSFSTTTLYSKIKIIILEVSVDSCMSLARSIFSAYMIAIIIKISLLYPTFGARLSDYLGP